MPRDFDALIAESRAKHIAPAIGAVWIGSDKTISLAMHGKLPSTGPLRWHIGSCTKAMTATVLARLADRQRIDFGTPLQQALPAIADRMHPDFRDIPLSAVLTHNAGLEKNPARSTFRALYRSTAPLPAQREFLAEQALSVKPLKQNIYSNLGYIIAGAVIEAATGQTWEHALATEVMIPLGIAYLGSGPPAPGNLSGHYRTGKTWISDRVDNPEAYGPAGRINLALEEWGRFLRVHLHPGSFLSRTVLAQLHEPSHHGFAMGWLVSKNRWNKQVLTHTGSINTWFAQATLLPEHGFGFGIVCNAYDASVERAVTDLSRDLMDHAEALTS